MGHSHPHPHVLCQVWVQYFADQLPEDEGELGGLGKMKESNYAFKERAMKNSDSAYER